MCTIFQVVSGDVPDVSIAVTCTSDRVYGGFLEVGIDAIMEAWLLLFVFYDALGSRASCVHHFALVVFS